jgi:hypothetical protein
MSHFITNERLLRFIEDGNIRQALNEPLQKPASRKEVLRQVFQKTITEDNVISTVTLGKFLFDYLRINPLVVRGIDFAYKEQFSNLFEFSCFAGEKVRHGMLSNSESMDRLKGYVAERFAAWDLQAKGHEISWPSNSNNPGWDILVDGKPFQVKCVTDPSEVWTHLRRYPNIPVLVNSEMAEQFGGVDNVHIMPTLSERKVISATRDTLSHGAGLTRFEIPWITLMVMSGTAIKNMIFRRTDLTAAFATTFIDTTSRTFMGYVGRQACSCAGSFLFGPAGWVIGQQLGQVAGARYGKPVADSIKQMFVKDQVAAVYDGVSTVLTDAAQEIDTKIDCKDEKEGMLHNLIPSSRANSYVQGMLKEGFQEDRWYLQNKKMELLSYAKAPRSMFEGPIKAIEETCIVTTQAGVHPQSIQSQWKQVSNAFVDLERQCNRFGVTL